MIKKLRNKETREIGYLYANKDVNYQVLDEDGEVLAVYDTLSRLIDEWEDCGINIWYNSLISGRNTIEIDFPTEKEAKEAMVKLTAWERLKEKGFKFTDWYRDVCEVSIQAEIHDEGTMGMINDLDICFGGEE